MTQPGAALDDVQARLSRLEAIDELRRLKQAYAAAADAKYNLDRTRKAPADFARAAQAQADCFTTDAIWQGGPFGGDIRGRAALFDFFCRSPWLFTTHAYLSPVLHIDGDRATGLWQLWQVGIREDDAATVLVTGRTREHYLRVPETGWRISEMKFEQLHSLVLSHAPDALRCLIPLGEKG
jgi:hypothetical protein